MMSTETDNTFGERESICVKQTLIDQLFSGKAHAMTAWPLKMVYLVVDKTDERECACRTDGKRVEAIFQESREAQSGETTDS